MNNDELLSTHNELELTDKTEIIQDNHHLQPTISKRRQSRATSSNSKVR